MIREPIADVRKIVVLRANALGDFIFTLPALQALRETYPQAEMVLLGKAWHAEFWRGRPGPIDRVVVVPAELNLDGTQDGQPEPPSVTDWLAGQVAERYDLALQLFGGGRYSNPFIQRLGARVTAGCKAPDALPLDRWIPYEYWQNEILRFAEVVALVGAEVRHLEPQVTVTAADCQEADGVLPPGDQPLAVLHVGSGGLDRRWPPEKFARVAEALHQVGAQVAVIGTPPERDLVDALLGVVTVSVADLCGKLSIGGLAGLLSRARLLVSNDSGPLHLAAAVGAATVGIFWCGNAINAGPFFRTRHRPVLSWRLHCPVCGRHYVDDPDCGHSVSAVADLPVEAVLAPALELWHAG